MARSVVVPENAGGGRRAGEAVWLTALTGEGPPVVTGILPFLAATDLEATLRFYECLGFERVICEMEQANGIHGMLCGRCEFMFYQITDPDGGALGRGVRFYLDVEDVIEMHARARRLGACIVRDLEVRSWAMREFTLCDPNGYVLTFAQPAAN
jgi:uncharacterized glyoxalase superfamily protein PhnB